MKNDLQTIYPFCAKLLPSGIEWGSPKELPEILAAHPEICGDAPFLADLAAVERAASRLARAGTQQPESVTERIVRPGLELIAVNWRGLPELLAGATDQPSRGRAFVLLCGGAPGERPVVTSPSSHDLLALKIVSEGIPVEEAAREGGVCIGAIEDILWAAVQKGLLLAPPSTIVRPESFRRAFPGADKLLRASAFTLQWHLTQACDLRCRHCYDRSSRPAMALAQGLRVLDQLYDFCRTHHLYGQVSFTGGNPLLSEHFHQLYREARARGLLTAILGNPISLESLEKTLDAGTPEFYQVSLEGLAEHNDYIRGEGHFATVLDFLAALRKKRIFSMVMLTLTRANLEQVLPLAEILRDRVDLFTFNRLAMVGEGAALASVEPAVYRQFLQEYLQAAETNPILRLKDNLLNVLLEEQGLLLAGGCAGHGCGAAFNFVALLPDGEVHACRKLPSPLGNILHTSLAEIYHSPLAERYRQGSSACATCAIRPACGGCPAVTQGFGLDIFSDLDPYCLKKEPR